MYKFLITLFIILLSINIVIADQPLQAGVFIDEVPKELLGGWRIAGYLDKTNSPKTFKPQSADSWTLSRVGDNLILYNPNTGARSIVSVDTVEDNIVVFSQTTRYDNNKELIDTVRIRLNGNKFSGINNLTLKSYSLIDNHLMKTETATYLIKGEKVYGDNAVE